MGKFDFSLTEINSYGKKNQQMCVLWEKKSW